MDTEGTDCMAKIVDPVMTHILKADHLSEETRLGYCKRQALISSAAGNKPLIQVQPKCWIGSRKAMQKLGHSVP